MPKKTDLERETIECPQCGEEVLERYHTPIGEEKMIDTMGTVVFHVTEEGLFSHHYDPDG